MNPRKDSDLSLAVCLALRSLFDKSRKTLEEVSLETGISTSNLSRTHTFDRAPSFVDVFLLCGCYRVTAQEFTDLVEKMKLDSSTLKGFRNLHSSMKDAQKKFKENFVMPLKQNR